MARALSRPPARLHRTLRSRLLSQLFCAVVATLLLSACEAPSTSTATATQSANLPEGWTRIDPGGDTRCSDGSPYHFYVRRGDASKLMVYLQGGGACWNLQTCDPIGQPTYLVNLEQLDLRRYDGIFKLDHPANPLADHTMVFAPYCSGDVHLGAAEQVYERTDEWLQRLELTFLEQGVDPTRVRRRFTVLHRGFTNMRSVLDWAAANLPAPRQVLVTGSSAGAIPSPYYALKVAQLYPDAEVTQLGDGAGGYRRSDSTTNPNLSWNTVSKLNADPAFAGITNETFNYEQLYSRAKAAMPSLRMHAYDTAEDDVQLRFLALGGSAQPSLLAAITANQQDIAASDADFRSFIAGGELHTILARPEFYSYRVGDRSVRDWVADLIAGRSVENVRCDPCTNPETSDTATTNEATP